MPETSEEFVKKTFIVSFYVTTGILLFMAVMFSKFNIPFRILYFFFIILFITMFFYFIKLPDVRISQKGRDIDREIVFVGRFIIIELESGVTLYQAMVNVSKSFRFIGKYFKEITDKIDFGTTMEDAIRESIDLNPNSNFRRLLWQILNVMKTGGEITYSLNSVLEQIVKEHIVQAKEYGKKLTPLAMFYLMIAVIIPSLGIVMLIVVSSFLSLKLDLVALLSLAFFLGFVQFMFVALIKSSRPALEM